MNRALKRALGERRAAPYRIVALDPIAGTRYRRFGLALAPETVTLAAQACAPGTSARPAVNNRP